MRFLAGEADVLREGFGLVFDTLSRRLEEPGHDLNWRPDGTWNSEGVLVRHVCAACIGMVGVAMAGLSHRTPSHDEQFAEGRADRGALRALVAEARQVVDEALDATSDFEPKVPLWGGLQRTKRQVALLALGHANHHVGQMALMDRLRKARPA